MSTATRSAFTSRRNLVSPSTISSWRSKSSSYASKLCMRSTVSASLWIEPLSRSTLRKRRRSGQSISDVQMWRGAPLTMWTVPAAIRWRVTSTTRVACPKPWPET